MQGQRARSSASGMRGVPFEAAYSASKFAVCGFAEAVTHNPEIAQYSSRNIVLRDGQIKDDTINTQIQNAAEALAALPKQEEE